MRRWVCAFVALLSPSHLQWLFQINFEPGSAASSGRITSSDKLILDDRILRGGRYDYSTLQLG